MQITCSVFNSFHIQIGCLHLSHQTNQHILTVKEKRTLLLPVLNSLCGRYISIEGKANAILLCHVHHYAHGALYILQEL